MMAKKKRAGKKQRDAAKKAMAKRQAELGEDDYQAMRKVIGYVHRHLAQRPKADIRDSRWRHSLMNWGHDPLED